MTYERDSVVEKFTRQRAELNAEGSDVDAEMISSTCLAVGFLLGAGFPGSAAAISTLADRLYPHTTWPWDGRT